MNAAGPFPAPATSFSNGAGGMDDRDSDALVRATDDDAAAARLSAVRSGYLTDDPVAAAFVHGTGPVRVPGPAGGAVAPTAALAASPHRRPPIINRGTYARIRAVDAVVEAFVAACCPAQASAGPASRVVGSSRTTDAAAEAAKSAASPIAPATATPALFAASGEPCSGLPGPCQIVSLGAGTDTRYFRYKSRTPQAWTSEAVRYFEVDFDETVLAKISTFRKHKRLFHSLLPTPSFDSKSNTYKSDGYALVAGDLRDWDKVVSRLEGAGFDPSRPTLVLAECVLVYLEPTTSARIRAWTAQRLPHAALACYDHIRPDDAFGQMMVRNLKERGITLPGMHYLPTADAHRAELRDALRFERVVAMDMDEFWNARVPSTEKDRIAKLEIFDEIEEWCMMGRHYCYAVAAKGCLAQSAAMQALFTC